MALNGQAESAATNGFDADQVNLSGATSDGRWDETWDSTKSRRMSIAPFASGAQGESVESTIDKADIQNPSDALEILAQVAGGEHSNSGSAPARSIPSNRENGDNQPHGLFSDFPPFVDGIITYQDIIGLFDRYASCEGTPHQADSYPDITKSSTHSSPSSQRGGLSLRT
jgi:hypothetical protein